jgi:hypothetical protein
VLSVIFKCGLAALLYRHNALPLHGQCPLTHLQFCARAIEGNVRWLPSRLGGFMQVSAVQWVPGKPCIYYSTAARQALCTLQYCKDWFLVMDHGPDRLVTECTITLQ